jgi:hypothetical protein
MPALSALLEDLMSLAPDLTSECRVLLATRRVDGTLPADPKQVSLREVGDLEIDLEDPELKFVPEGLCGVNPRWPSGASLGLLREWLHAHPAQAMFEAVVIDRRKSDDAGTQTSLNVPVLGVCLHSAAEAWFLLAPQSQWPSQWFSDARQAARGA